MITLEEYAAQSKLSEDIELLETHATEFGDVWDQLFHELLIARLRELRARRIADGREPDDEVNAPADMCCCHDWPRTAIYEPDPQFAEGCPLHPRHRDCDGEPAADECRYLGGVASGALVCRIGPPLRCGRMRLMDCGGVSECDPLCEPADEGFPF